MSTVPIIACLLSIALLVYLFVAMMAPEKFE